MMKTAEEQAAKLYRMKELNALLEKHGDEDDPRMEKAFEEYRTLQAEMVPLFLPLVQQLVDAGLLTCAMDIGGGSETEITIGDYTDLTAAPVQVFDNGNIWLHCEWAGEGELTEEAAKRAEAESEEGSVQ
jgi:hypothetical protein